MDDRLRTNVVNVAMSGGLDSASVAAVAQKLLTERSDSLDVRAFTVVYDRLMPDHERHYAGIAAGSMAIPLNYLKGEDYATFSGGGNWFCPPEPFYIEPLDVFRGLLLQLATHSRVTLTGWDGDSILNAWSKWQDAE